MKRDKPKSDYERMADMMFIAFFLGIVTLCGVTLYVLFLMQSATQTTNTVLQ